MIDYAPIKTLKQSNKIVNRGSSDRLHHTKLSFQLVHRSYNSRSRHEMAENLSYYSKVFQSWGGSNGHFTTGYRRRTIPALLVLHIVKCVHELKNAYKSARLLLCLRRAKARLPFYAFGSFKLPLSFVSSLPLFCFSPFLSWSLLEIKRKRKPQNLSSSMTKMKNSTKWLEKRICCLTNMNSIFVVIRS